MSAETLTFKVVHLLGVRPEMPAGEVFVAPRPLFGLPAKIEGLTNWAGLVVVREVDDSEHAEARRRRWEELSYNHRMNARLIVWTERAEALQHARDYLTALYPSEPISLLTDAELLGTWRECAMPKQVTVTGTPDPTHPTHRFEDWTA